MKTHGDAGWDAFPSYFDLAVPRFLDFFQQRDCQISVFVVGKDAELPQNQSALQAIVGRGHEIANHSYMHQPWLHTYTTEQVIEEFDKSEAAIEAATGVKTIGFRGPGFTFSGDVLRELVKRGYRYDASTFPTFIGPMAKAYFQLTASFSKQQKEERKELFGGWSEVFRSNRPYRWDIDPPLVEIPVTTIPVLKTPFHATYLTYLATFSEFAARRYFDVALSFCRMTGVAPSVLYHPLDFIDHNDCPELSFFPGMKLPYPKKLRLLGDFLDKISRYYQPSTMAQHADALLGKNLRRVGLP